MVREDKDERREGNYKRRINGKHYRGRNNDKGKKSCYIAEERTKGESKTNDDEIFYFYMKEYFDEDEKTTLIYYVNKSDRWITDSECSNHMTSDKEKIENIGPHNGGCIKFGNNILGVRKGKGKIQLTDKIIHVIIFTR